MAGSRKSLDRVEERGRKAATCRVAKSPKPWSGVLGCGGSDAETGGTVDRLSAARGSEISEDTVSSTAILGGKECVAMDSEYRRKQCVKAK